HGLGKSSPDHRSDLWAACPRSGSGPAPPALRLCGRLGGVEGVEHRPREVRVAGQGARPVRVAAVVERRVADRVFCGTADRRRWGELGKPADDTLVFLGPTREGYLDPSTWRAELYRAMKN